VTLDFETFRGTWLYEVPAAVIAALGALIIPAIVLGFVALGVGWSVLYIVKGGGQYGIIEGYVGTIGAGKTTLAVQHALSLARARGALLLSNIPVVCGPACKGGYRPPGVKSDEICPEHFAPWRRCAVHHVDHRIGHELLPMNDDGLDIGALMRRAFALRDEGRGLVLLLDEVGVIMPARLWKDFPVGLMWTLQQSRKLACEWIWTAQDPSFVDGQLRSLTSVVHYVRSFPPPSIWRRANGKRPWLLVASAFMPGHAPRANSEGMRAEKRIGRRVARYRRAWELAFDTDGVVLPSRHLKGAAELVDAARASGDRHVIASASSTWGPSSGGAEEPV
jgi:hypothetical protein